MCYFYNDRAIPFSRTLEIRSAAFLGDFSLSEKRNPVVDFQRHQLASTCSNCPTTAKRVSCVTSCAMLLVWTQALSCPNNNFTWTIRALCSATWTKNVTRLIWTDVCHLNKRRDMKDLPSLHLSLFKTEWALRNFSPLSRMKGDAVSAAQSNF